MWTIFGAGELVWDIIDAIESIDGSVEQIVLNKKVSVINFEHYKVITLKKYLEESKKPRWTCQYRIFGFIDPNKQPFLEQINQGSKDFHNVQHARAWVCRTVDPGTGNYFAANSTIASKVVMESFNYINRNASVGHHTIIGSYNHIGPGAIVCGKCKIGNANFIGAGAVIKDGITIKDNIIVGANALVTRDLTEKGVYIGSPARHIDSIPGGIAAKFHA
jgi:sugar O-acyltransferase (sialic acid O-acetyltransferase NeuD family)